MMPARKQQCPNCPGSASRLVFATDQGRSVVQCNRCRLQFQDVYPDYEEADREIYSAEYFKAPIEEVERRRAIFNELISEIELVVQSKGRLLDIGAGEGTLLAVAGERGWEVEGTEIASEMVEYVRRSLGIQMYHGALEEIPLGENRYNAIVLNHVLEHVRNPRTTLEKAAVLLCDGGVVRIEVPNIGSLSSRMKNVQSRLKLKSNPWKHYSVDHHFWFFTPDTLTVTIATAGLRLVDLRTPYRQWGGRGMFVTRLNSFYSRMKWGKHIVAYARRSKSAV